MTKEPMKPKEIDDFEVLADNFRIKHRECISPKKFDRYMMLTFLHSHHKTDWTGLVDVFLTKEQALRLIKELADMIHTNDVLYPEKS